MLSLSPAYISSWLNLQYKAVILSVFNILSSFSTDRQARYLYYLYFTIYRSLCQNILVA